MIAKDVMVSPVITVGPAATVREVASLLLENHISAVPVVDAGGRVIGIVSEGDLIHRSEAGTERRYSWWLRVFTSDRELAENYVKSHAAKVTDIMTSKVVTVTPETPLHEIAAVLEVNQVKRVPVVTSEGDLVGIISRSNLIQAVATSRPKLELTLPDVTIRQNVLSVLNRQNWAHSYKLNVTVANGVVDLWGWVDSESERNALRVAAESVSGVRGVRDHMFHYPSGWQ